MKYLIILISMFITTAVLSQDFKTDIATAKTSYASGNLEDAHFALQQAMQEIDIIIGKQVISLLPANMGNFSANTKDDNVMSNVGFMGSTIHRTWGQNDSVDVSIIGNSPLISTLNVFLNTPLLGGMMSNGNNKIIKVQGYKGQITKSDEGNGESNYTIQIPMGSSLLTFTAKNTTDTQITTMANTLPLQQIAKLLK
ncbi:MAG: hypothetical protein ABJB05_11900 [Parafilimonas sp.]